MKVSLRWLKEFVDFDLSPEDLARLLRSLGFDTASITRIGAGTANVVTAKVEAKERHPNADKLSLCAVFDGRERFKVVCGAPNVAAGQTVVLARLGARLPGGVEIKPANIRGQESQGMLCSARELGLGEDQGGILVLPPDAPVGQDAVPLLQLDDAVLDVEVMPNRPDMLSHWGVAREIAAALKKPLKMPAADVPEAPEESLASIDEKALCSRYIARVFDGVKAGPGPLWMRLRLERCGIRPINALVDVTNYVLLELGHPLHVFDRDMLKGGKVVARLGRPGEKLACLDGQERPVDGCLVIADAAAPQAAAGVMGGAPSGVSEKTTRVLLEAAHFHPSHVRQTRRKLNLASESSYRFERGTDGEMADLASRRAAHLILSCGGGRLTGRQDVHPAPRPRPAFRVDPKDLERLLGFPVSGADVRDVLERLGCALKADPPGLIVEPPVHRSDLKETADVAEELGRFAGLDKVPARLRGASQDIERPSPERRLLAGGREALVSFGFQEAVNTGLVSKRMLAALSGPLPVELSNPLSQSGEFLAPSLLPQLLLNVQTNARRGAADARFFEAAKTFSDENGAVRERLRLAFVAAGADHGAHWKFKPRALEFWDAKAWVKALLKSWRLPGVRFTGDDLPPFLHPAQAQTVSTGGASVGSFGRLHPRRAQDLDLSPDTFVAELDLTALAAVAPLGVQHRAIPQHPALVRDFSLVFPEKTSWSAVALHIVKTAEHVEDVRLFDVYKGKDLPEGRRSLAFQVTFRHPERTITDAESARFQDALLKGLQSTFEAVLRG